MDRLAHAHALIRQALDGGDTSSLSKALTVALKDHTNEVDSPRLAMRVLGCVTDLPLSFHVVARAGLPDQMPTRQGIAILEALRQAGASPNATIELDEVSYTPHTFLLDMARRMGKPVNTGLSDWMAQHWSPTP